MTTRQRKFHAGERPGTYRVDSVVTDDDILAMAREIARKRLSRGALLDGARPAKQFIEPLLRHHEQEVFGVVFLDTRNRVIAFKEMFRGTLDGASVYPREVVKLALSLNAGAVIFAHNHPSGDGQPSGADVRLTERLKSALSLVDVRALDHIVVGVESTVSMVEAGLI